MRKLVKKFTLGYGNMGWVVIIRYNSNSVCLITSNGDKISPKIHLGLRCKGLGWVVIIRYNSNSVWLNLPIGTELGNTGPYGPIEIHTGP